MTIKQILLFTLLLLLTIPVFAKVETPINDLVQGMSWISFLTPIIVYFATNLAKLISKFPPVVTLLIVTGLSSVTGYLMQLAGQTEHWYFTALIGLGSVFINEFKKRLIEKK